MSHADLAKTIDDAFETARRHRSRRPRAPVREAVEAALDLLDRGEARVAERGANGDWTVNQWLKKAVLLSFRLNDMSVDRGRPRQAVWWDKVPSKFDGWDATRFRERRLSRGAGLRRAALGLYRAGRRADAELRQSRRLCRLRHHGRHLGDGRLLRADRQELPHLRRRRHRRRAGAAAGRARSSSRTIASSARARKWPRA